MTIVEIRDQSGMAQLRPAWDALLRESSANTIFLTPEWVSAWWSAYGTPGELRVLAGYEDGVLRGIAPLRVKNVRRYGQTVQALQLIGDAPIDCDSDYLDFIIAPGYEKRVLGSIRRHVAREQSRGTVLLLNEIPEQSPNVAVLRELAQTHDMDFAETEVPCGTVRLPERWDDYLAMLKPRFRTKVRSVLRNLENRGDVQFKFCGNAEELDRLLPALYDLHGRRWREEGKPGVFRGNAKRNFYRELSPVLLDRGWLQFSYLEWNGRILACQYGFTYNNVYSQLQEGYEPDSEHWNVGVALRAWSIREYIKAGVREYDFLGGMGRHKADWGAQTKYSKRVLLAAPTPGNVLFVHGPRWEKVVRKSVRAIVPDRLLTAGGAATETASPSGSRLRRMAATFYVNSMAPALLRSVRERYQVSFHPTISCRKRLEGGARIFYYHRVNDDNDPFFGATPTAVFEAHMRYLARHYRVVSMGEVSRRLEGDSREMVVGVTFDDGYRDNYEHAFPILKRYNIPATVFLTTGSLDSGEPLWFEAMAEAIKQSGQEYLDLEFDIPRRFWLRTQAERLETNGQLFALLRELNDTERRTRLDEIVARLGTPKQCERRGKMLSWDQVRLMKANGIDFGGHTVTHPFLSKLTPGEAAWEVTECKRRVEQEIQSEVDLFAYPNGREEDFASSSKDVLRHAGYRAAVTTIWGMNYSSTDPMELRRGGPWEDDPALFALKLDWYQFANQ
jgi:peptidoglycan/xylan/chitin deacetylase (PgdA/CDA1 family)/CelD/BcsL family acetyltransferase involved in cellulose biosynthesis